MSYYPIKCIRCASVTTNEQVLFDTKDAGLAMTEMLAKDNQAFVNEEVPGEDVKKDNTKKASIWDDDEDGDLPKSQKGAVNLSQYMTRADIERYSEHNGLEKCIPYWQSVDVTPDFAGAAGGDEQLLIGVGFQKKKGGAMVRAKRRFCPVCRCELPSLSGSMPTYNVTVMGTSASGKTVYLSALNWLLSQSQGNLPYSSSLTCISANKANADFVGKSNVLFEKGILPGTTQIVLTEPLVVQMTYRLRDKMKKCLLALADMRGEDLIAQDGENLIARGEFFSRADAFMVLVSPLNIPGIRNALPQMEGEESNVTVHQTLMANISEYILPFFSNGMIDAPTVVMMSKCDVLMNNAQRLQIHPANPVVAAEPPVKFTHTYFRQQDQGTKAIMEKDRSLSSFLQNTFSRTYFTSFSSLGRNVSIEEDEKQNQCITNPNAIRPIRVIDPIIYILISLGFLPDFSCMEAGAQYNEKNVEILSRWIEERT